MFALLIGGVPAIYQDVEHFEIVLVGAVIIILAMIVLDELLDLGFRRRQHAMMSALGSRRTGIHVNRFGPRT